MPGIFIIARVAGKMASKKIVATSVSRNSLRQQKIRLNSLNNDQSLSRKANTISKVLWGTCDWSCYRRLSVGPFHEFSAESWSDLSDQCRELFLPLLPYSFRSTERYPLRQFVSLFTFVLHLLIYITIISWIYPPTQEGSKWRFSLWSPITNKFNIPVPLTPGKGEGGVELKIMG